MKQNKIRRNNIKNNSISKDVMNKIKNDIMHNISDIQINKDESETVLYLKYNFYYNNHGESYTKYEIKSYFCKDSFNAMYSDKDISEMIVNLMSKSLDDVAILREAAKNNYAKIEFNIIKNNNEYLYTNVISFGNRVFKRSGKLSEIVNKFYMDISFRCQYIESCGNKIENMYMNYFINKDFDSTYWLFQAIHESFIEKSFSDFIIDFTKNYDINICSNHSYRINIIGEIVYFYRDGDLFATRKLNINKIPKNPFIASKSISNIRLRYKCNKDNIKLSNSYIKMWDKMYFDFIKNIDETKKETLSFDKLNHEFDNIDIAKLVGINNNVEIITSCSIVVNGYNDYIIQKRYTLYIDDEIYVSNVIVELL